MGNKCKISDANIKRMKLPREGSVIFWDIQLPGFGVRLTSDGAISFVIDYRNQDRKQRRYTLGRWPILQPHVAREEALSWKRRIREGEDPLEEKKEQREQRGKELTFSQLLDHYLQSGEFRKKRDRTQKDYRSTAERMLRPTFGSKPLKDINRHVVDALHADLHSTPYMANRALAVLSILFNYAIEEEWMTTNPTKKVKHFPEDKSTRFLSEEEISRFLTACDNVPDQQGANALRLLLFTGARLSEVLNASWDQFDLERCRWNKQSHHVKEKKQNSTHLIAEAMAVLTSMRSAAPFGGPLFPGRDGKQARVNIRRTWQQVLEAAGLVSDDPQKHVRIHDLRHTFVSHLVLHGVSLKVAGALVGHTQVTTTDRYANLTQDDEKNGADQFSKVIQMPKRTA